MNAPSVLPDDLAAFRDRCAARLLEERAPDGTWVGELSSSALSTATAVTALLLADGAARVSDATRARRLDLARAGTEWLVRTANQDGGYGDTTDSPSNLSTTTLAWVALGLARRRELCGADHEAPPAAWLERELGHLDPARLSASIQAAYGTDRTFSVPILAMCALGGRLGEGRGAWRGIPALPFELAALPHGLFQFLGLPMVSYALPALIAIGQAIEHHRPTWNPLTRLARAAARKRTLRKLRAIQPTTGGYLEATPLTSFVTMSLVGIGAADHPVVGHALEFLERSAREDGSWPIDTDLASWVTSLAVHALAAGGRLHETLDGAARDRVRATLLGRQYRETHPYTRAAPGGWAWTGLSGGVPDADDTPAALLALDALGGVDPTRAAAGARWLLDLQNGDGGIPTFCRGWGKLPFDRSSPDLTAHALRAWRAWRPAFDSRERRRVERATRLAVEFLGRTQREDGAWVPLWFGNQHAPELENPLYGTTRVLLAHRALGADGERGPRALARALDFVLACQEAGDGIGGGFGGAPGLPPTIEETGLAVEALVEAAGDDPDVRAAAVRGARWLQEATLDGEEFPPSPIGLYFAKLWYHERLYPLIFTVAAMNRLSSG